MRKKSAIWAIAATAMLLSGCSTKPRNFSANLTAPVPDRLAYENDYRTCQKLVQSGRTSDFKAGAAQALATGAGTMGATAIAATAGGIGIGGATTAASVAIPGVGLIAGFGVARAIRGGKERKFKRNMSACLQEYGYSVGGWAKLHKRDDAARIASQQASILRVPADPAGGDLFIAGASETDVSGTVTSADTSPEPSI